MIKNKGAFTLVELIVVVTIMGILATIGFVSFTSYLAGTRDTNRIAQLKSMSEALVLYKGKNVSYPLPDDYVEIKSNGEVISYQGYIGKEVLEKIGYSEKGLDPKDKEYFSYYVTKNKRHFELMALLEEEPDETITAGIFNNSYAEDYLDRYAYLKGDKLGIITNEFNVPLQMFTGTLDISNIGDTELIAHISDDYVISGINTDLAVLEEIVKNGGSTISSTSSGPDLTGKCAISQDPNVEVVFDDTYKDDTLYYGTGFYIQSNTCLKWQANDTEDLAWAKDCEDDDDNDKDCEDYTEPEWDGTKYIYDGHYPSGGSEDDFQVHKYCESLGEGWRVPTKREFMSIMTDVKPSGMDYYTALPSVSNSSYWSNTIYKEMIVKTRFGKGLMSSLSKNYQTNSICIHD